MSDSLHAAIDAAVEALAWQIELGADEAIAETPIDRYAASADGTARPDPDPRDPALPAPPLPADPPADPAAEAAALAEGARDLADLADRMRAFEGSPLRQGATSFVFSDGKAGARVMIVGEAPGRDEDRLGKPFVGKAGRLLDRMFAAIGLARDAEDLAQALYITNVLPWWPPGNRTPDEDERRLFAPFVRRHIALAGPELLVPMGNTALTTLTGQAGIMRRRGRWTEIDGRPALPMLHPSALLRQPLHKREAWADLRLIRARLGGA